MADRSGRNNCDYHHFARLIPQGTEAENALDTLFNHSDLHDYHRSFISVERRSRPAESGSELSESEKRTSPTEYWSGGYTLSLSNLPTKPVSVGWRIGRGSSKSLEIDTRGVDIILIRPKAKAQGVAAVHARIQFHPLSGVLMLVGVQQGRPIEYQVHDSNKFIMLDQGEKFVLYQKTNSFKLGSLHYILTYENFTEDMYERFVSERYIVLRLSGYAAPHSSLSAVPRLQDNKRGPVILHGSLTSGKFGWISSGVNAETGDPLAVKEHRPKNEKELEAVINELDIGSSQREVLLQRRIYLLTNSQAKGCFLRCRNGASIRMISLAGRSLNPFMRHRRWPSATFIITPGKKLLYATSWSFTMAH